MLDVNICRGFRDSNNTKLKLS